MCRRRNFAATSCTFFLHGGRGLNVTLPHKLAAAGLANELTPRAERAGAVNTLMMQGENELIGDNTDGEGLVRDLQDNCGVTVTGTRILILGAGGAARGVLAPLLELQPSEIVIANRTAARASTLAREFAQHLATSSAAALILRCSPSLTSSSTLRRRAPTVTRRSSPRRW
jgi:shikimate dehydrogenase